MTGTAALLAHWHFMSRTLLPATVAFALAGCSTYAAPPPVHPAGGCANVDSSDWAAWVNAMPGPGARPTLIVTGKVTVPTGGYEIGWDAPRIAESYPVQVFADLRVTPPNGPATQAVVTHDVRGQWPIAEPVGSVTINCGNRVLARISPVETAQ